MIKLVSLVNEVRNPKKIDVTYIETSGKLYSIKLDGSKTQKSEVEKRFDINIPARYDERLLDKIKKEFKKIKVSFTYNDAMDIS
tara:strand:+ start:587 stop:838 length:252 start_codon:yes stop_codon:yes gene_type:complete